MSRRDSLDPSRSLWHLIAVELRRQRELHKMSGTQLGVLLGVDRSTVSRYESGMIRLALKHAKIVDREWYTEGLFAWLVGFAEAGNEGDWFAGLTEYEARATRVKMWETLVVPGLLQTPDYARAVLSAGLAGNVGPQVEKRVARQAAVFDRDEPPEIFAILNWVVLEELVGSAEIMRAQLARLIEVSELPNVSVRVLGKGAGAHRGREGPFHLLTVDDRDVAYADAPTRGRLILDVPDVQHIAVAWDRIGDLAAPVGPSRGLIERAMETYQ